MSNIHDLREQLRTGSPPSRFSGMGMPITVTLVGCAVISAVIYFLILNPKTTPLIAPLKPSASVPTFRQVVTGADTMRPTIAPSDEVRTAGPQIEAKYAGLGPRQIGKLADEVCFARAQARVPHWSKTPRLTTKELNDFHIDEMPHFNELMHCLLTEAPARYCSSSQRGMITAEISMYFRGLEHGNRMLARLRADIVSGPGPGKLARTFEPDPAHLNRINQLEFVADSRVIAAIEARLRDGTLTKTDRETFSAAAPEPIRQRFASVKPSAPECPIHPWWAFWRGW